MSADFFSNFLDVKLATQTKSIQAYLPKNQKVWLKKASKRHASWIYFPLRIVSKILGLHLLTPVPNYGGEKAIACEIARIRQLKKLGIRVPEILAYRSDAVLLKDAAPLGQNVQQLEQALSAQANQADRLALLQKAVDALQHLHDQKGYLSEAFARNILVDEQQQISFVDFETDPRKYLSLKDCQTRDWLYFIFSTGFRLEEEDLSTASLYIVDALSQHIEQLQAICRVGRKLHWVLKLKPENLGSDGRRMTKCIGLLKLLNEHDPLPMI